ncbi:hypothetical protein SUGI_0649460 [Cryptomeria japonica]|nr:hypothetical protein SUGI_0649460 [Cryptomeria japonica]
MLVYEYMSNGSVNSFFSGKSKEDDKVLDWNTIFGIALGTAIGLLYLHEECMDCIIHCDIKPENILRDVDFSPKVVDFGLAKLVGRDFSIVLTTTRGTRGYLAPEWLTSMSITTKESQYYFPTWVATQIQKGNTMGIVDERIADKADIEEVRRAVMVSILCIQQDEDGRPSMAQVVKILEGILEGDMERYERSLQVLIDYH